MNTCIRIRIYNPRYYIYTYISYIHYYTYTYFKLHLIVNNLLLIKDKIKLNYAYIEHISEKTYMIFMPYLINYFENRRQVLLI